MRILLDTHIFLWLISGDSRLDAKVKTIIQDPAHEVYLNVVSVWEAIIKYQRGRLPLPESPETYLPKHRRRHFIQGLSFNEGSVSLLVGLPSIHQDPFDRALICQALHHGLVIATLDAKIRAYPVAVL